MDQREADDRDLHKGEPGYVAPKLPIYKPARKGPYTNAFGEWVNELNQRVDEEGNLPGV